MEDKRLSEIKAICDYPTSAPWELAYHAQREPICRINNDFGIYGKTARHEKITIQQHERNAAFIVSARVALPECVLEIQRLKADIAKLRILAFVRCPLHQKSGLRYDDMYFNGKCEGYCRSEEDDEPLEVCKKCELHTYYDECEE